MTINKLAKETNEVAHSKGFWDKGIDVPQKLMLIVSELSEAMEADRESKYVSLDKLNNLELSLTPSMWDARFEKFIKNTYEDELADVAIRLFDLAYEQGIDLEKHIQLKMRYNATRPHMHGKRY